MFARTMATWGGSTQCALDEEDGDEDGYLSDGLAQAEEEEEEDEQESISNGNFSMYPHNNINPGPYCVKENKERLVVLLTNISITLNVSFFNKNLLFFVTSY